MKRIIILLLLSVISIGAFASATSEGSSRIVRSSSQKLSFDPIGRKQIEPNKEIINLFTGFDAENYEDYEDEFDDKYYEVNITVDSFDKGVNPRELDKDIFRDIDLVLEIDPDDLKQVIYEELRSYLVEGKLEYTYMILGDNIFSSTYSYN